MTDVPEGTIVRCITRLDETCREVRDAARVIGDRDLFTKMEEAQDLIKRDSESDKSLLFACRIANIASLSPSTVVFAASLVSLQEKYNASGSHRQAY